MTAKAKIVLSDAQLIQMVNQTAVEYEQEFRRLLGDRPDLRAPAALTFEDQGIKGGPVTFPTNVYTCLLINFYGMNDLGWECGVWDCLDSYNPNTPPNLHQDQPERAYPICGSDLEFTVACLGYLNKTFGTTKPVVPEYMHRNGPLFDNILRHFRSDCQYADQHHPRDAAPLSETQQKLWSELTESRVMIMMANWVRGSGLEEW